MTFVNPGDVDITSINLHSIDGKKNLNIIGQVVELSVFESIHFPVIRAEIIIHDAIDIINQFPIVGEERVQFEFFTRNSDQAVSFDLYVSDIVGPTVSAGDKAKVYQLRLVSKECLINQTFKITRSIDQSIDKSVQTIFSQLNSSKKLEIESCKGIDKLVVSKLHCLQAIDMLRQRAVSPTHKSSAFVFFENQHGFQFTTIEKLLVDGKGKVGDKVFFFDQATQVDSTSMQYRNVLAMETIRSSNIIHRLNQGQNFGVKSFDIFTGKVSEQSYINSRDQSGYQFAGETVPTHSSTFEQQYGRGLSQTYFVAKDSSKPENFIEQRVLFESPYQSRLQQHKLKTLVWGDSTLSVGDVIEVTVPSGSGSMEQTDQTSRLHNGKYLISDLRHHIIFDQTRTYLCSLELVRGNYEDVV